MLFLTEADVLELLPMEAAIERVESSLLQQHRGAVNRSRERILLPRTSLHYMAAALPEQDLMGMKIYTVSGNELRFVVLLYHGSTGDLLALLEADQLGRLRTGAASGVATKYLARADASRASVIGTGRQARTQLEAVSKVRRLSSAKAFGRDSDRLVRFCEEMTRALDLPIEPAPSAEAAVRYGEIVITATTSRHPVLQGAWLQPGAHVNAVGANFPDRREVDNEAVARASVIAVDTLEQAREEAGDLILGLAALGRNWDSVTELHSIVAGDRPGRRSENDVTIFKSSGIALWDVAAASYVYQKAREGGKGRAIPVWDESTPRRVS